MWSNIFLQNTHELLNNMHTYTQNLALKFLYDSLFYCYWILLFYCFWLVFFKLKAFSDGWDWSGRLHINLVTISKIPIQSCGYYKTGSFSKPSCFSEKMFSICTVNLRYPEETEIIPCWCRGVVMKLNQMLQLLFGFGAWSYTSLFTCIFNSFL